jgi:poly(3-hydroxybutyrate) depolymerase
LDNTPSSKPTTSSSSKPNNHSYNDSSSSNESSEVKNTFFSDRPEKNIKSFDIKDEFSTPTYQKKIFKDAKSGKEMRYCLYLPENYSSSKKYPVLLFMHGLGNVGDNYIGATFGIAPVFKNSADIVKSAIIVAPQASDANGFWPIHNSGNDENGLGGIAMRLLLDIEKTYSCDKNRIYITGNSMGGHGTWNLIETYGDHFAAAIPICGWGNPLKANNLKNIPIWIYHGDADPTVPVESSRAMYDAIKKAGSTKIHYTELPGVQHDSWTAAYENRELISWMFSQNKATNPTSSYELIPFLKVCDNNSNIIISEKDTTLISFITVSEIDCLELKLTDNGAKKLESAYKKSSGKTFSVYYGNVKIMTFTATKGSVDKTFYIHGGFNAYNYYEYIDKINSYMN